ARMFQSIVQFGLRHRVFVLVAAVMMIAWGLYVAPRMPIDLLPEIRRPTVVIVTEAGSLATEEVEQLVSQPLEMVLNGMPGVVGGRRSASPSYSNITVVFEWGTDPFRNRQLVTERLALVRDRLPAGVVPLLAPMAATTGLIMHAGITGGSDAMSLRDYV